MSQEANLTYRIRVRILDKDGNEIFDKEEEGKSFVSNYLKLTAWLLNGTLGSGALPVDRSAASFTPNSSFTAGTDFYLLAPSAETNYGILLGTVANPSPTAGDTNLGSAVGAGWSFGATTGSDPSVSGNTVTVSIQRTFTNNTGANASVTETGLAVKVRDNQATPATHYVLIAHDALPGQPLTVPNGGSIQITYSIQTTT